ncbi:hypothetical protein [Legionella saoudiensis]|uniref:hypothetical protein n=1 Tax=Legionella saoudiensis TaxID=1750561 RepID=UPI000730B1C7|nr:hypothetical protein [Legionella saoudiensis]
MMNIAPLESHGLIKEITIVWTIDDVQEVRPGLTKAQASAVLFHLKTNHDAAIGINWDVIGAVCDYLFGK